MAEHDELESYWEDVNAAKRSPILVISGKVGDAKSGLELAATTTSLEIQRRFPGSGNFIEEVIRAFANNWCADILRRGSGALIELVLEDSRLTIDELKAFIRALPASLIQRIVDNGAAAKSAQGIHALLSVEHLWRTARSTFRRDYLLGRDVDGTLMVTVYPNRQGNPEMSFRMDETFSTSDVPT